MVSRSESTNHHLKENIARGQAAHSEANTPPAALTHGIEVLDNRLSIIFTQTGTSSSRLDSWSPPWKIGKKPFKTA